MHDKVLILDFGAQYTQLIARRVREAKVYCEIHPCDVADAFVREFAPKGVILSGSHMSAYEESTGRAPKATFELGVPVLGICYGMQTMAQQLGGKVEAGKVREFGYAEVRARGHTKLLDGLEDSRNAEGHGLLKVWMSHGDKVVEMPPGFKLMASTEACPVAGMADEARRFYGVQFHPEVTHTRQGTKLLQRFVHEICGCAGDWNMPDYVAEAVAKIREQVASEEVILGLSGGVDSSVAAALIHKAIDRQLTCVFVDHGLLRLDEAKQVMDTFAKHMKVKVVHVDAGAKFLKALQGVADPEHKRRIIGKLFVDVFQKEAKKIKGARWLAQGTIYPDVIESAGAKTKKATTIKSHHNVGGLPETLHLKLLEPLRELFKDEVRELGLALGPAARDGVPPSVPRAGTGRAHPRRSEEGVRGPAAPRRRHLPAGAARGGLVRQDRAGVRGVSAGEVGGRHGRRPHLRVRGGAARRADHRLHDRGLDAVAARFAGEGFQPHHQRGARHQPRGLRHLLQTARHHRMGIAFALHRGPSRQA